MLWLDPKPELFVHLMNISILELISENSEYRRSDVRLICTYMYPAICRPGVKIASTRRLIRAKVATDECFKDGMASVCHNTAILRMGVKAWLSICTIPSMRASEDCMERRALFSLTDNPRFDSTHSVVEAAPPIQIDYASFVDPIISLSGLCHSRLHTAHPLWVTHMRCLPCGPQGHRLALHGFPKNDGP